MKKRIPRTTPWLVMVAALLPSAFLMPAGGQDDAPAHEPAGIHETLDAFATPATPEAPSLEDTVEPMDDDWADAAELQARYAQLASEQLARLESSMSTPAFAANMTPSPEAADSTTAAPQAPGTLATVSQRPRSTATVAEVGDKACSTHVVRGLSEQLMGEIEVMRPGTVASIEDVPNLKMGKATLPYLQKPAVDALRTASANGKTIKINSALRSLAQQYLLHRWYRQGRCGIPLAASPGRSNHESGLALDIGNYGELRSSLTSAGWRWLGGRDPVHFDFSGNGAITLQGLSVKAFQRLWNRNNPHDQIPEDGQFGPATAERMAKAPADGFLYGPETAVTVTAEADPIDNGAQP